MKKKKAEKFVGRKPSKKGKESKVKKLLKLFSKTKKKR
jgi:hypothetical protein